MAALHAPEGETLLVQHPSDNSGRISSSSSVNNSRREFRGGVPLLNFNLPVLPASTGGPASGSRPQQPARTAVPADTSRSAATASTPVTPQAGTSRSQVRSRRSNLEEEDEEGDRDRDDDGDAALIREFNVEGANAEELLGYDDEDEEDAADDADEADTNTGDEEAAHAAFKKSVRVKAVRRAEGNRRAGGIKTQKSMVKAWEKFKAIALKQNKIQDGIVDEHSLLLYIEYSAEREKLSRRGEPIPNTRIGASQLKKQFFVALRIRKEQDAEDTLRRPATTSIVWDAIKNRMDEALERVRNGLDETEDAPDIRANTFLSEVTDEQLQRIGYGFFAHRQCK
ncbi:hypothetical protein B0H14DRAFT_3730549 [Mycena olivaceomarginata]|nr:hypothetical protein B0H14DRAFT_3730549 [Mycena olivaceomarginata]